MTTLPAVPKVVRVEHHMQQTGNRAMMVRLFYQYSGALSLTDATTWLQNIVTSWNSAIMANMTNNMSSVSHSLTDLTSVSAPQVLSTIGVTATGGGTALPAGTAMVIRFHTLRRYRGGKSRMYLPGQAASSLLNSTTWTSAAMASYLSAINTYIAAATANTNPAAIGTITHVNVSYFAGFTNHTYPSGRVKPIPTPRVTPLVDTVVSNNVNPTVGTQRRRNEQSA